MSGEIRARGLGKKYKLYSGQWRRLAEWLSLGRLTLHDPHWALRGVDLEIAAGEAVGIVGQNGAGKSTLLKLIVGTTRASEGTFEVAGRATALLELGMGFHPDFTGRQNASMTLRMAGFDDDAIEKVLPEAIEFAELGEYIDQPLRTYSSGMQVRLGFAVATARRPDILIVDEALSVGDAYFQHKCIRRIRRFKAEGTTMLFVSHDPVAVKTLCDRAVLLDRGRLVREGSPESVLDYYNGMIAEREKSAGTLAQERGAKRARTESGDRRMTIASVTMRDADGVETGSFTSGERASLACELEFARAVPDYAVGILIRDRLGNEVFGVNTSYLGVAAVPGEPGERVEARFELELALGFGHYVLSVAAHSPDGHLDENYHWIDNVLSFQVLPGDAGRFVGVAALPASADLRRVQED